MKHFIHTRIFHKVIHIHNVNKKISKNLYVIRRYVCESVVVIVVVVASVGGLAVLGRASATLRADSDVKFGGVWVAEFVARAGAGFFAVVARR